MGLTIARTTQTVTINSGALLSTNIDLRGAASIAVAAPTITSGQLYLQVGVVSGSYLGRLHDERSQAAWFWNAGPGSASIVLPGVSPWLHAAIETQNSQANLRSFTVVTARG